MEQKRSAVAGRFAANLVGQMLQRSGADFYQAQSSSGSATDFLVRRGDDVLAIEVKYTDDLKNVPSVWEHWLNAVADAASDAPVDVSRSTAAAKTVKRNAPSAHLVIVTDNGDTVFTDAVMAPLLATDQRTSLSILDRDAAIPKLLGSAR